MSPAKIDVLRILYSAKEPLKLRQIAELSSLSLRPIQLALNILLRKKIIKRRIQKNYHLFEINELPYPIQEFLRALETSQYEKRNNLNRQNASSLGPFQEDAFRMITNRK